MDEGKLGKSNSAREKGFFLSFFFFGKILSFHTHLLPLLLICIYVLATNIWSRLQII
jgi:hypothetical protein